MNAISNNQSKHDRYVELYSDLKKAISSRFFLEAIFIEYAILEDRTMSILTHAGRYNETLHGTLNKKISEINVILHLSTNRLSRYLSIEVTDIIRTWVKNRNSLIHHLPQILCCSDDVKNIALEGFVIVKKISNASTSYRRYSAPKLPRNR